MQMASLEAQYYHACALHRNGAWHVMQRDFEVAACALDAAGGEHSSLVRGAAPTIALQLCSKAAVCLATGTPHAHLTWEHTLPFPSHKQ